MSKHQIKCPTCGRITELADGLFKCACGNTATGMFCNSCGSRKPAPVETWDCTCGNKGIVGNFCNNCGKKRGE